LTAVIVTSLAVRPAGTRAKAIAAERRKQPLHDLAVNEHQRPFGRIVITPGAQEKTFVPIERPD
jgi:hypothetical protein